MLIHCNRTLILHYWSHLPPLLLVIKAASWRLHCQRWGPLLLTDLLCKIPHHNVFATYIIHIYGLFCGRESYVIWCTYMMHTRGTRRMFVKIEPCRSLGTLEWITKHPHCCMGNSCRRAILRPNARGIDSSWFAAIVAPPPPPASSSTFEIPTWMGSWRIIVRWLCTVGWFMKSAGFFLAKYALPHVSIWRSHQCPDCSHLSRREEVLLINLNSGL